MHAEHETVGQYPVLDNQHFWNCNFFPRILGPYVATTAKYADHKLPTAPCKRFGSLMPVAARLKTGRGPKDCCHAGPGKPVEYSPIFQFFLVSFHPFNFFQSSHPGFKMKAVVSLNRPDRHLLNIFPLSIPLLDLHAIKAAMNPLMSIIVQGIKQHSSTTLFKNCGQTHFMLTLQPTSHSLDYNLL